MPPLRVAINATAVLAAIVAVVVTAALALLPGALGVKTYAVLSGSMEPAIHTGSIIAARPTRPQDLRVGDVIVFKLQGEEETVTHRIVEVHDDGSHQTFKTKGDANGTPDVWTVQYDGSAGKVVMAVPMLGYIYSAIGSQRGRLLLIVMPAVLLAGMWLVQIWAPKAQPEQRTRESRSESLKPFPRGQAN